VRIRCSVQMGSREGVREAVAQGLGLGVVAANASTPDERLVLLPMVDLDLFTHVHLICLKERLQAQLITRFLEAAEQLRTGPRAVQASV